MGNYTCFFEEKAINIFAEEDYIEELKKIIGKFRTFGEALDSFILEQGYSGETDDIYEKVKFISEKCNQADVPVPRNLKKWYTENKRIERNSTVPFQLCFAFQLNVEEVNDFLRRICLSRGLDCHSMEEIVYFFAFKHGLKYSDAKNILSKVNLVKPDKIVASDLIYTDLIADEIEEIETEKELIDYLNDNAWKFVYNNATAYETIQTIWKCILGDKKNEGIAKKERKQLYIPFDKEEEAKEKYEADKGRKERKRVCDSVWEIYLQILGLAGNYVADFYKDRSLKAILKDNELLHPLAEEAFPDRDGLNKILNGEHVSYERIRKVLILLVFYRFYAGRAIKRNTYEVVDEDGDRCIDTINDNLISANYQGLYPGNPYDFLILMALRSKQPLCAFREYMHELFYANVDIDSFYEK